jgi:hypothetical protein
LGPPVAVPEYLFELVQNALDAGARSVAIHLQEDGDGLVFLHDGRAPLQEHDVEGLSKIFRSTRSASSFGLMGIGFESVFGRFREARVSGWGWTFRYEVPQVAGEVYQDVQLDLLGGVTFPPPHQAARGQTSTRDEVQG